MTDETPEATKLFMRTVVQSIHARQNEPLTDEQLSTMEGLAESPKHTRLLALEAPRLIAEIRSARAETARLRSLFTEADALKCEAVARHYESGDCGDLPADEYVIPYRGLAERIRHAFGQRREAWMYRDDRRAPACINLATPEITATF